MTLEFSAEAPAAGAASRSTSQFDLVLDVPKQQMEAQRKRLEKENEQLVKNIASLDKQLGDEASLSRKPEHVVASMRAKKADYEAQLAKNQAALDGLGD